MNLIRNAIKFTQFGSISLKVHYESHLRGLLTIEVSDTGTGIAQKDMPLLFTRFGKLQRTASLNHHGIGLGLNIVKQIVDSYKGHIEVYSDGPGQGSTFIVKIELEPLMLSPQTVNHIALKSESLYSDPSQSLSDQPNKLSAHESS